MQTDRCRQKGVTALKVTWKQAGLLGWEVSSVW